MNSIAIIILVAIVADAVIGAAADYLNLKVLRGDLPGVFKDVYDPERYAQSQAYLKVTTRFNRIVSLFSVLLLLVFWFGKGFYLLDRWVVSLQVGPVLSGLLYIGVLLFLKFILTLPFGIYDTFVIEERFGFNKTDPKTFIADLFKGMGLTILLGGPLLAGILWFFGTAGGNAWWICWVIVTLYLMGVQFVAPTWILPIFNKFSPIEEGDLKKSIIAYASSIDFPLENVFVMDGSRRSSKSNAFFTGFGKHKRIVLFDTLVAQHSVGEVTAVLGHEMGHYRKKHILKMLVLSTIQTGVMFLLLSVFISEPSLFEAFYVEGKSVYAGIVFFSMLYAPVAFFTGILLNMLSRKNEYEADRFAVTTTRDRESMAGALKTLSVQNLSNLYPHPFYVFLHYSHPPVLARLSAIAKIQVE